MSKNRLFNNQYFVVFNIILLTNIFFSGCYSLNEVTISSETIPVHKIETSDGEVIDFRETDKGNAILSNDEVIFTDENGKEDIYPVSDLKRIYTEDFDYWKAGSLGLGIVGAAYVLLIVLFGLSLDGRGFGG